MNVSDQKNNKTSSYGIKQISLIELDFHHEVLDGFLKIFLNTGIRIHVFTTKNNEALLRGIHYSENIKFYSFSGFSKYLFLKKHRALISASDLVFVNTIANDFGAYLALPRNILFILRVHNVNKQFRPLKHISIPDSGYLLWKFSSYVFRQVIVKGFFLFRPIINRRVSYFTFTDEGIEAYVRAKGLVDDRKIMQTIPLKIFNAAGMVYKDFSEVLNITVIGVTDARKRRYETLIEALTSVYRHAHAPKIHLTLLGNSNNAYGKKIIGQLSAITHGGFSFSTFNKPVVESEFLEQIHTTHLIISPVAEKAITDIFTETYGQTKTSGSILDFLKFGKVTLVPGHFPPPEKFREFILNYQDASDLARIIFDLLEGGKINELNKTSLSYVKQNFSQEKVLKETLSVFSSLLAHE